ncbi:MAG TPA: hypothetical protein VNT79_03635 [Phycisphaerae bacterium]|nr:hypothetical protein [Phycisphaerae bacterium]
MSSLKDIEKAVRSLSAHELEVFRRWFIEYDANAWDEQFERDATAGKLEGLAAEALQDLREGRCKDL